jgi:hypothetical protein
MGSGHLTTRHLTPRDAPILIGMEMALEAVERPESDDMGKS